MKNIETLVIDSILSNRNLKNIGIGELKIRNLSNILLFKKNNNENMLWENVARIRRHGNLIRHNRARELERTIPIPVGLRVPGQRLDTQPIPQNTNWLFAQHGLTVDVMKLVGSPFHFRPEVVQDVPKGAIIGVMHFTPVGSKFVPEKISLVLAQGIAGLDVFFEEIDNHDLKPTHLIGYTNERMAKFAASLGFKLIPEQGDGDENCFGVVGEIEIVRRMFIARKEKGKLGRLFVRANRQPTLQSTG